MSIHRLALAASAAVLATALAAGSASAMPLGGLKPAAEAATVAPQNVAWFCGPHRCWWRPGPVWGPYRWHRHHRRWW